MPTYFLAYLELLDSKQAFQDLNQYMDIEEQSKRLSNRALLSGGLFACLSLALE